MRKWLLTILAFQVLSSGQALGELMKVVNLLDHYRMHIRKGEVRDLSEFIRLHYFDPVHERSDPARHRHLPLQQATLHHVSVLAVSAESVSIPSIEGHIQEAPKVSSTGFHSQQVPMSVFQPPRA
ncbi:MAG: hypothetical protein LW694_07830 [Chitinophagaceae bacterium]|nr:hypothetical protein [Chitinophagaceae bacterium]